MIKSLKKTEYIKKANKNLRKTNRYALVTFTSWTLKKEKKKKSNNSNVKIYRAHIIYKK